MIVATDVHYVSDAEAQAAAVVFDTWASEAPRASYVQRATGFGPYVPGRFFERELPCLLPLLYWVLAAHDIDVVVVDGYVDLGGKAGLGRHVLESLAEDGPPPAVVGVAKSPFDGAPAQTVLRGEGSTPLFVTAAGMPADEAADAVLSMHGRFRLPALLLQVDHLARGLATV